MDIMSASIQVLGALSNRMGEVLMVESTVEPPFKPEWILQKGFFTYMWDRAKRYWGGTRASYVYRRVNSRVS
jgi:hypothetical protein